MNESSSLSIESRMPANATLSWLARSALLVLVVSIAGAHAPSRIKLLGLFFIGLGWIIGAVSAFVTKPNPTRATARMQVLISIMAMLGLAGSTWLAFRSETAQRNQGTKSSDQKLAENLLRQMEEASGGAIPGAGSDTIVAEFHRYLTRRVRQLGDWRSPWPELFWVIELIAGAIAAPLGLRFSVAQISSAVNKTETSP